MLKKNDYIEFRCLKITQPIGSFYVGAIDHEDLIKISFADVRRIEKREVEEYLGVERPLSKHRVAELRDYVNIVDATFPSSVILAVESENAEYKSHDAVMRIKRKEDVAKIIDGQHRIAGLGNFKGPRFQVNVTVFIDMDIEDQAMVFATINLKQTKVSRSLSYDLYEYAKARSPQKTCHNIAKLLNNTEGSPFKDKIKILGVATGKPRETLTQAAFVDRLLAYISKNPMKDRDSLKRGKSLGRIGDEESQELIFRNMFTDKKDAEIAKIVWNYFSVVEEKWGDAWRERVKGNILNRTTGFGALMRFLRPAYLHIKTETGIVEKSDFSGIFKKVTLSDKDFTPDNYKPGSSGETLLLKHLEEMTGLED